VKTWILILISIFIFGCATHEKLEGSANAPAAEGKVTAKKVEGDNTELTLDVQHLAPPERISSGAKNYVVWIKPEDTDRFINIGAFGVDNDLKAHYKTTIPYPKFELMLTPESDRVAMAPSGPVVFDKSVKR
jgi:hypothetical protein